MIRDYSDIPDAPDAWASDSDAPEWFIWAWLALLLLSPAMVWALGGEL